MVMGTGRERERALTIWSSKRVACRNWLSCSMEYGLKQALVNHTLFQGDGEVITLVILYVNDIIVTVTLVVTLM